MVRSNEDARCGSLWSIKMRKLKRLIPGIILADTFLFIVLRAAVRLVLHLFRLTFRKWFTVLCIFLITVGIIAGIIQLLLKIRRRVIRVLAVSTFVILITAACLFTYPIAIFVVAGEEHVVERDEGKFVAYVDGFLHTYVYYYEYKNYLICGEVKRIEEDYGKGGFDPIGNPYGNVYSVVSTTYFDADGNVILSR